MDGGTSGTLWTDAIDFDRDGDIDILASGNAGIAWYENINGSEFSRHLVNSAWAGVKRDVRAADMDRDGDFDLVAALPTPGAF